MLKRSMLNKAPFKRALLAATAVLATGAVAGAARADILIAMAGPLTGQYAAFGEQIRRGVDMAVKDLNESGGLLGQPVKVTYGDDACDPKQAVAVANQLAKAGAKVVIGHYCSGSSIPASQVYNEEGILQITPASTNPGFTEQGFNNVFRLCGRDDQQGQVAGKYLAETQRGKNIAILHDKSAYGKGLADETKKNMNAAGVQEKMYEAYTAGEKDYSALVSKLKQNAIDAVYIGGYHTEAGLIRRQMTEQNVTATIYSGDAMVTDEFWSITGPAGEGTMMTFAPDPRARPEAQAMVEKFRKTGYEPEGYTLLSYAAVQVFADAARKAKSADLGKVAPIMHKEAFDTAVGTITFDGKGDPRIPTYVWYRWHDGKYAMVQ